MRAELAFPLSISEISSVCGATVTDTIDKGCTDIHAITTDSRLVQPGDMFVALRGTHSDGHLFLSDALSRGAALCLSEHPFAGSVTVPDTAAALTALAAHTLRSHPIPVIAITGSVGKTGTKDAVSAALSPRFRVHKTKDNMNNALGVAFTLLSRPVNAEILVLEFGTNSLGEIASHAKTAPPDVAILTAIGQAHIGAFGSREGIFAEKSSIFAGMSSDGLLLINGDDPYLSSIKTDIPTLHVGLSPHCSPSAGRVSYSRYGTSYTLQNWVEERRVFLRSVGRPQIYASLFAIAVARHFGVAPESALDALFRMPHAEGRQAVYEAGGVLLIDDAYNASPESMAAALEVLLAIGRGRRRIAVLGDMLELGAAAHLLHKELGRLSATHCDLLYAFGDYAQDMLMGALEAGKSKELLTRYPNADVCCRALLPILTDGDVILVKASHAVGGLAIASAIRSRGK